MRRSAYALVLVIAMATLASAARAVPVKADGLPVTVDGVGPQTTVPSVDGGDRFAAMPDGNRTRLLRIATEGGEIAHTATIPGTWAVPAVAVDGTPGGPRTTAIAVLINPGRRAATRDQLRDVEPLRLRPSTGSLFGATSLRRAVAGAASLTGRVPLARPTTTRVAINLQRDGSCANGAGHTR